MERNGLSILGLWRSTAHSHWQTPTFGQELNPKSVCLYGLSVCLSVCLPSYLSSYLPIFLPIYLFVSVCLSICLSVRPSVHPSIHLSFHPAYLQLFVTHLVTTASPGSLTIQHNVSTPCPKLSSSVPISPRSFPFNKKAPQRRECTRTSGWWTERVMNNVGLILTIQTIDNC